MKALSKKITQVMIAAAIFFMAELSWAGPATPQKYCESLAAVSCEVLNLEVGGCGVNGYCVGTIKYCRNRAFQVAFFTILASNTPDTFMTIRDHSTATVKYVYGGGHVSAPHAISSATMCTYVP